MTRSHNKARIQIKVQDSGIGISEQQAQKLFNPFTQADESTSRNYGGTGLGLVISRELSRLMGGDITLSSIVGQGSVFSVALTLKSTKEQPKQVLEQSYKSETDLSSLRVLIAEDNRINQKLINTILNKFGIKPDIVDDGYLAVKMVAGHKYDVVLMDCQMPELDGYQATEKIRAMDNMANLPIIALTADVDTRSKERAIQVGMNGHIAKPIDVQKLKTILQQYV